MKLGYRTVYAPRVRALTIVGGGILGDVDRDALGVLLDGIQASLAPGEADVAILRHLPMRSAFHHLAATRPRFASRQRVHETEAHWELDLPPSFDALLGSLSPARSKSLSRTLRARWINLVRTALLATTTAGKRVLGRGEIFQNLKRRWRLRLQQSLPGA